MDMPWDCDYLKDWMIVGANHYRMKGARHLFVAMTKGDLCIKAEGADEQAVFLDLQKQAARINEREDRR